MFRREVLPFWVHRGQCVCGGKLLPEHSEPNPLSCYEILSYYRTYSSCRDLSEGELLPRWICESHPLSTWELLRYHWFVRVGHLPRG